LPFARNPQALGRLLLLMHAQPAVTDFLRRF